MVIQGWMQKWFSQFIHLLIWPFVSRWCHKYWFLCHIILKHTSFGYMRWCWCPSDVNSSPTSLIKYHSKRYESKVTRYCYDKSTQLKWRDQLRQTYYIYICKISIRSKHIWSPCIYNLWSTAFHWEVYCHSHLQNVLCNCWSSGKAATKSGSLKSRWMTR
jgi:hypothetical protein